MTLADVARAAQVSKMTVSNVINGKPNVRPLTRQRVLVAIEQTGYRTNPVARALAGGKQRLLSVVARRSNLPYATEVIRGASEAAEALDYELVVMMTGGRRTADLSLFLRLSAGVLLVQMDRRGQLSADLPPHVVSVDGPSRDTLTVDNHGGACAAMQHLLALGHTRIAYVSGLLGPVVERDDASERLRGYRDSLTAAGLPLPGGYLQHADYSARSGEEAAHALMRLPVPPTAIFAAGDAMAVAVIHTLQDQGLRVPEDVSVVGFDDLPYFRGLRPALTTVRQPLDLLGGQAIRLLVDLAEDRPAPLPPPFPTTLIVRESTAPPPSDLHRSNLPSF
ncbi:LacI family DNA-binding transcriptional regulator [Deinococcus sp. UYEF24]